MQTPESINGKKANDLIAWLETSRTLIKVAVPRSRYERLTLITHLDKKGGAPVFSIDPPEGVAEAISEAENEDPPLLQFEFSGEDRLLHRFESDVAEFTATHIWLQYPEEIQRYQLRDNFRIKAPSSAELSLTIDDNEIRMAVDNISMGGIFCLCANAFKALFSEEMACYRLGLIVNLVDGSYDVRIDRAVVRRIEKSARPKEFGIAFQFASISGDSRERLKEVIYELQRRLLKKRNLD